MSKRYDAAIIGAGPGGYAAAIRLSQLEKSVCVIDAEEDRIGGVCLNEGCIPVKSLLSGAKVLSDIKKARGFGVEADIRVTDMRKLAAHASGAGLKLRGGIKALFKKHGVVFIEGRAKLVSADKISVASKNGETDVEAGNIIIAAGSSPRSGSQMFPSSTVGRGKA